MSPATASTPEPLWRICGAPPGGCGGGRRRAILTTETSCGTCGSEMRVARSKYPRPPRARLAPPAWSEWKRWRGNCYEVAARFQTYERRDLVLCHGWPRLRNGTRNPEHVGKQYGHAWLESADGMTVFDLTVPGGLEGIPALFFYALGRIESGQVVRYQRNEAAREMLKFGHYGPWTEEPEGAI